MFRLRHPPSSLIGSRSTPSIASLDAKGWRDALARAREAEGQAGAMTGDYRGGLLFWSLGSGEARAMDKPILRDDEVGPGQRLATNDAGEGFLDDLSRAEELLLALGGHLFGTRYHSLSVTYVLGSGHDPVAPRMDPLPMVE